MFGKFLQALINLWIRLTGRKIALKDKPWLDGPVGAGNVIGDQFYKEVASTRGLKAELLQKGGLLTDFSVLISPFDPNGPKVNPRVVHFYENTAQYKLEVWSQWYSFIRPFARILIRSVSTRMNQLNIPLAPLETSHGMSSDLIRLSHPKGNETITCWLRKSVKTQRVVYAGFYSACWIPALDQDCVRVVFPMPKGSVTVVLRVEVQPDGSVKLLSHGSRIGEAGYYRIRQGSPGFVRVKYLPLKEVIHVFEDETGTIRTDHEFFFWGIKFLHLHYKVMEAGVGASS